MAIEAMRDSSIYEKEAASNTLDGIMRDPDFWLADVSGLWLDCPALEPCQALFSLHASLPNPGVSLHSSGGITLTCVPSRCQRS